MDLFGPSRTQKLILDHFDRKEVLEEEESGSGSGSEDDDDEMNEDED